MQLQRHISIATHFSGCVVPFKKGDMKTSPVVVDQPRESRNVSTQCQVRSGASTLEFPENFEGSKPEKNPEICHIIYIYIYSVYDMYKIPKYYTCHLNIH